MKSITKLDIEIVDSEGRDWTFKGFATGSGFHDREAGGVVYECLVIGGIFTNGVESIPCSSLSEAPTRFPQVEINKIEEEAVCRFEGIRLEGCPI